MHASDVTPEVTRTANRLYWTSGRSVNQIADELDLSKGALYGVIAPEPSGLGCPLCGSQVGFANRTAKEREFLTCPTCEWDGSLDQTVTYDVSHDTPRPPAKSRAPTSKPNGAPRVHANAAIAGEQDAAGAVDEHADVEKDDGGDFTVSRPLTPLMTPRLRTMAGGALLGGAVGLALVLWARRQ